MKIKFFLFFVPIITMLSCSEFKLESGKYMSENNLFYGLEVETESKSIQFYLTDRYSTDMLENDFKELQNWKNSFMGSYTREGNEIIIDDLRGDILPSQRKIQILHMELNNSSINCNCVELQELLFGSMGRQSMCENETIVFVPQN